MTALPPAAGQRLALIEGIWSCARCLAPLTENLITHQETCPWVAEIAAADPTTETEGFRAYKAGAAAERERLVAVMGPEQFRKLADWFDTDVEFKEAMFPETWSPGSRKDEVQQDLRRFADLLEGKP